MREILPRDTAAFLEQVFVEETRLRGLRELAMVGRRIVAMAGGRQATAPAPAEG